MKRTWIALAVVLAAGTTFGSKQSTTMNIIKSAATINPMLKNLSAYSARKIDTEPKVETAIQPEISTKKPLLITLMLDRSESMSKPFHGSHPGDTKAQAIARNVQNLLRSMATRLTQVDDDEAVVKNYVALAAIGYSGEEASNLFSDVKNADTQPHPYIVPIRALANDPRLELETDVSGGAITVASDQKKTSLIEPLAYGNTPMGKAARVVSEVFDAWTKKHKDAHPPIAINLTDGQPSDFTAVEYMKKIRETGTNHGPSILMNVNISSSPKEAIKFPNDVSELSNDIVGAEFGPYARMLFEHSSQLPAVWVNTLLSQGYNVNDASKAMLFNGNIDEVHRILEWGTRATLGR